MKISKKIIGAIFVAVVLVVGAFFYDPNGGEEEFSINNEGGSTVPALSEDIRRTDKGNKDSDEDGLKDWEEILHGTDRNNPDTDGDGTPDGEEVAQNRNPLVSGPNDETRESENTPNNKEEVELTNTGEFGVKFLSQYLNLRSYGRLEQENAEDLIYPNLTSNLEEVAPLPKYTKNDLAEITGNSSVEVRQYGNSIGQLFENELETLKENELAIITNAVENAGAGIENLEPIINAHDRILSGLLNIPVPSEAVNLHLALLRDYGAFVQSLKNISQISSDPLVAVLGISQYKRAGDRVVLMREDFADYFDLRNVTYSSEEPGRMFN